MKKWTRRSLLGGAVVVMVPTVGLSAAKVLCGVSFPPQAQPLSLLMNLYSDAELSRKLGERYLAQAKSTVSVSLRRLQQHAEIMQATGSSCPVATLSAVQDACRDDFRAGRTYCIDGWVLAETELDIAALRTIA